MPAPSDQKAKPTTEAPPSINTPVAADSSHLVTIPRSAVQNTEKELEALKAELAQLKSAEVKRGNLIRQLAHAIMTPAGDAEATVKRLERIGQVGTALLALIVPKAE